LPPERTLAEELGASRATIRAALAILCRERLVEKARGRGARVAPPLSRLSKGVIGVLYPEGAFRLYDVAPTLLGVQQTLMRLGYAFEFAEVTWREGAPMVLGRPTPWPLTADNFLEHYGAGVFWEYATYDEHILELERRHAPVVVANMQNDIPVTATWVDHRKASRSAVNFLAAMGHRRIAFVGRDPGQRFHGRARQGYLDGLAENGIAFDDRLAVVCDGTSPISAYAAIKPLLLSDDRPTGVVAARDLLAQGVCHAMQEAGLALGRDVSVIGFDDASWPVEQPFLTTFRMPSAEMGAGAAEMLVERIVGGWRPPERREMEAPLVVRQSVGLAPGYDPSAAGPRREVALSVARH